MILKALINGVQAFLSAEHIRSEFKLDHEDAELNLGLKGNREEK